jgi:hypothetical protein
MEEEPKISAKDELVDTQAIGRLNPTLKENPSANLKIIVRMVINSQTSRERLLEKKIKMGISLESGEWEKLKREKMTKTETWTDN